ncbi:Rz-like lysis system protein LysB [Pseudocitrobacter cyperus]|uniref:Rz-like lysis system protein LysB n=1 Tax=Pseudocitrobacter cyperus TaxID=3112843 RepID=A0ABV0HIG9_9ENTR
MNMRLMLLMLVAISTGMLIYKNASLARALSQANREAEVQGQLIRTLQKQLRIAGEMSAEKEQAQVALRERLDSASARAQRREQTVTRLLRENETLRRWYGADLPDAVRRLHRREACASAANCLQRLPEGQPVPDAGQ